MDIDDINREMEELDRNEMNNGRLTEEESRRYCYLRLMLSDYRKINMKRFLLFAGHIGFKNGGWGDFKGSFDTLGDAKTELFVKIVEGCDWGHVVDGQTGEIIKEQE
jgi:hypothetical protein